MKEVPFIGGAFNSDDAKQVNGQTVINLYVETDEQGGRPALVGMPGLSEFVDLS